MRKTMVFCRLVLEPEAEIFTPEATNGLSPAVGLLQTTQPDPNSPLTFGKLQEIIARQRLLSQQQRLKEINRGPATRKKNASLVRVTIRDYIDFRDFLQCHSSREYRSRNKQ